MGYSTPFFRFIYCVARVILWPITRINVIGKENIPQGPAIFYANHSSWSDPVLMIFGVGRKDMVCMMSKEELFKNPILGKFFRGVGCFSVSRGNADVNALGIAERYIAEGRKVGIFPEGTRTKEDGAVRPKGGFLRIAADAKATLVPVYIERERKLFRKTNVVFGKPFSVEEVRDAETGRINYPKSARDLMQRIWAMKDDLSGKAKNKV